MIYLSILFDFLSTFGPLFAVLSAAIWFDIL